jgi:signal transduction histidine kinase
MVADITERKLAEAALADVSGRLIAAQEQERNRIGRELHDDIGQRLATLAIKLEQLHEATPDLPEVRRRICELQKHAIEITTDIEHVSHELHPAKLDYLGPVAAMRGLCHELGTQAKVKVDFKSQDLPESFPPEISLCLFRVLQEALHNTVKHSGAYNAEVKLWGTPNKVHLTISDSGAGFDINNAKMSRGLGLVSMEERLKQLEGIFSIESQPKGGTTIHASLPMNTGRNSIRGKDKSTEIAEPPTDMTRQP